MAYSYSIPGQQNVQPIFPQPQGNVYNINSTLEVANVPVGAGISVALCMNEGVMYIKSMQNGNPLFYAYKIEPYNNATPQTNNEVITSEERLEKLEKEIEEIKSTINKKKEKGGFQL